MEVWVPFTNYFDYLVICIGSYYFYIFFTVKSKFSDSSVNVLDSIMVTGNTQKGASMDNQNINLGASANTSPTSGSTTITPLTTTSNQLGLASCDLSDFSLTRGSTTNLSLVNTFKMKTWFIIIKDSNVSHQSTLLTTDESSYIPVLNNKVLQLTLEPSKVAQLQKNAQFIPANLNIMNQLSLGKQDRWFLKNSLLSDSLTKSSNNVTQSKRLLTTNYFDTKTSNNVWLSSKFGGLNFTEANKLMGSIDRSLNTSLGNLDNLSLSNIDNSSFNFFEDSRFFFSKRYFFVNQLKSNLWESQNTYLKPLDYDLTNSSTSNHINTVYVKSLTFNLKDLLSLNSIPLSKATGEDHSLQDIDLSLPSTTLLNSENVNFITRLTTGSVNQSSIVVMSKVTPNCYTLPTTNIEL